MAARKKILMAKPITFDGPFVWDPTPEEIAAAEKENRHFQSRMRYHCLCGRFAKWVGDQHYYNGTWNCYRYTVRCTRCGDVDIECV